MKKMGVFGVKAFNALGGAAQKAGKAMNAAMKATVILGIVQMVYDMFMSVLNAPATLMKNIDKLISGIWNGFKGLVNLVIGSINYVIEQMNRIPGVDIETLGLLETNTQLRLLQDTDLYEWATGFEAARQVVLKFKDSLKDAKDAAQDSKKELRGILSGIRDREFTGDLTKAGLQRATAVGSLGISGTLEGLLDDDFDAGQKKEIIDEYIKELGPSLAELSPRLLSYVREGNLKAIRELEAQSLSWTAGVNDLKEGIRELPTQISADNLLGAEIYLKNLNDLAEQNDVLAVKLGETAMSKYEFDQVFKDVGGTAGFLEQLTSLRMAIDTNRTELNQLNMEKAKLGMLPPNLRQEFERRLDLEIQANNLEKMRYDLQSRNRQLNLARGTEQEIVIQQGIDKLQEQIALEETKYDQNLKQFSNIAEIGMTVGNTLESSLNQAFTGIIQGTTSLKEAFKNLAKNVLQSLAQVIAKLLVTKILMSTLGGTTFGNFLGIPTSPVTAAKGGVFSEGKKMYATGGIAKGPRAGYPAVLHGTEAVVPLPDGKSIPVSMSGAGGQQNNVTVNVAIDGQGRASSNTQQDSAQAGNLGNIIAKAVQQELQNQKRSGGILNPYGVA